MSREHNIALLGAFMMEGLRDLDYAKIIEVWDQGCLELILEMICFAPFMQDLYDEECAKRNDSAPGTYVYEVTNEFGTWFGQQILKQAKENVVNAPSKEVCEAWIRLHTDQFFNQNGRAQS